MLQLPVMPANEAPWKDSQNGNFFLIHEDDIYHDYEPVEGDSIRGISRVTLCDEGSDYAMIAGDESGNCIHITREQALELIAGKWFPAVS